MATTFDNGDGILMPRMLINGELVEASDKGRFPVHNPTTREISALVPEATPTDTNHAVASALAAFPTWSSLDPTARAAPLRRLAALLTQHAPALARLEAISMGLPTSSFHYAHTCASLFTHYAEAWPRIQGHSSLNTPGHLTLTLRQPYGVAALILPWNAGVHFLGAKAAPALMAGCTVVLKASEKAPLAVARIAELIVEAGFPPGVFNVVSGGGRPCGAMLAEHADVRVLSFTGSARTGRAIQAAAAAGNLKKVVLELGGKSPALVFGDADVERAARETAGSVLVNSGQVCMANSRVYVERGVRDRFLERFVEVFRGVKVGDPVDGSTKMGPQADEVQYGVVMGFIEGAKEGGGKLLVGGEGRLESTGGYFVEPTVFVDVPEDEKITKEEVFGPVVVINTFDTEAEAIAKANDTEFGLYASVYTRDISRAIRVAKALESGYVAVNCTSPLTGRDLPFGGYKGSGQGREGLLYSMENFLETKSVIIKIDSE
ncbi:aldehyde dehydrogenase domain-containing protein [Podospora conica]|nr:aldehyde dehydrogenase domain-containing protein [Schizothecium conicum]